MKIALVQTYSEMCEVDANIKKIGEAMKQTDASMLVFPEMFLTGYNIGDKVFDMALRLDGKEIQDIADLCKKHNRTIILGLPRRDDIIRGVVYNSSVFIDHTGPVAVYDKWHLVNFGPFDEWRYFRKGSALPIFEMNGMRFGMIICYDIFFPELVKQYAGRGADAVICISASPSITRKFFETVLPARAIENTIYMAYANVLGDQKNLVFWGGNQIWGPGGDLKIRGEYYEKGCVEFDLDPEEIKISRKFRPTLKDTRWGELINKD